MSLIKGVIDRWITNPAERGYIRLHQTIKTWKAY
jgi:hypothetical protein